MEVSLYIEHSWAGDDDDDDNGNRDDSVFCVWVTVISTLWPSSFCLLSYCLIVPKTGHLRKDPAGLGQVKSLI